MKKDKKNLETENVTEATLASLREKPPLNMNGPVERYNTFIVERDIILITNRSLEHIHTMDNFKEKNDFLVKVINYFNEDQARMLEKHLAECDLDEFYRELDETGISIHIPSDVKLLHQAIRTFYEENEWIKIIKDNRLGGQLI